MNLAKIIQNKKILVVGDAMLDLYMIGDVTRISPEAPVPVFCRKQEKCVLGGATNVAANLVAANQTVSMLTTIGHDANGEKLLELLRSNQIDTEFVFCVDKPTTTKTRFLASNHQQVMRLDEEDTTPLSSEVCQNILCQLAYHLNEFDLIVFSDYNKGLLTQELTQGIIQAANAQAMKVLVDVKDTNLEKYKGAFLLKPNQKELHDLTGLPVETEDEILFASRYLREKTNSSYVLTTCGAKGMRLMGEDCFFGIDTACNEVYDVTGAGDTALSYMAACLANGMNIRESMEIANYAAGLQVSKVGTSAISLNEVGEFLRDQKQGVLCKLLDQGMISSFRKHHADQTIVFTNGCFDILHIGHTRYLQEAAKLGDILVVGLNSDASVKRLKGESRPVNQQMDRAELLCALKFVDYVVIFEEDTPYELIRQIQPDVLVKGGDYHPDEVVGKDLVEARGGRLELIQFVEGKSTTNTIARMKEVAQ